MISSVNEGDCKLNNVLVQWLLRVYLPIYDLSMLTSIILSGDADSIVWRTKQRNSNFQYVPWFISRVEYISEDFYICNTQFENDYSDINWDKCGDSAQKENVIFS